MKYIISKNQFTFVVTGVVTGIGIITGISLILFFGVKELAAQDWQPANNFDYAAESNLEYDDSYYTTPPLPDERVRLSNRIINQNKYAQQTDAEIEPELAETLTEIQTPQRYRSSGKNQIVHAAYNNQNQNKIIQQQNYSTKSNNKYAQNTTTTPRKLNAKTSTAAMTAAAKPKALPKHISREFDANFNIDGALADYGDLPLDNNIIVKRPMQTNTIQVSNINVNDCNTCNENDGEVIDDGTMTCGDVCGTCNEQIFDAGYCSPMIMKPFGSGILDNLTIFGAATGFKAGELDRPLGDNFGFSEGVNWSAPISIQYCTLSAQLGFRAVHSNINGAFANKLPTGLGYPEKNHRTQYFVTAGLFKRTLTNPLQAGVAFDHFEDNFYGKIKLTQLRFELSVRTFTNLEYGFIGAFGLENDSSAAVNIRENYLRYGNLVNNYRYKIKSQNYYMLFARKYFAAGNQAEFRIGATEYGKIIIGANGEFPINDRVALNGGFTTMLPGGKNGWQKETWDLSAGIVIYFRGGAMTKSCNENRPMFDVAQNGSFITRILRK
ncbi:MAG: hypothetical protein LBP59_13620 [Planctomycetaceae bacterium]|nr:hypothetical protein [Planctomycetaceae bacterium]